jgi:GT2 family glycosyltransferase
MMGIYCLYLPHWLAKISVIRVSVVIPAYNQSQYLKTTIQSVLSQTYPASEIIVVDDGSTDATSEVVREFGQTIQYIYQDNQGLAGARNTGIWKASGDYLAFLDSDDEWRPNYLEAMLALISANPDGAVYYCCAQCMDVAGDDLPQQAGALLPSPDEFYHTLLSANFLIPSTVLLKRQVLLEAGGFDETTRVMNGCEDWDLWLRLSSKYPFVGTLKCLARYRVHAQSMSSQVEKMQLAVRAVMEKHFGPDDGQPLHWSANKLQAYGGLYKYCVLSFVTRQNDWLAATPFFRKALQTAPALVADEDFFYELALGNQPLGYRGTSHNLELEQTAQSLLALGDRVFAPGSEVDLAKLKLMTFSSAYSALGHVAYNTGTTFIAARFLWQAATWRPGLWFDRGFVVLMFKALFGLSQAGRARRRWGASSSS